MNPATCLSLHSTRAFTALAFVPLFRMPAPSQLQALQCSATSSVKPAQISPSQKESFSPLNSPWTDLSFFYASFLPKVIYGCILFSLYWIESALRVCLFIYAQGLPKDRSQPLINSYRRKAGSGLRLEDQQGLGGRGNLT